MGAPRLLVPAPASGADAVFEGRPLESERGSKKDADAGKKAEAEASAAEAEEDEGGSGVGAESLTEEEGG